MNTKINDTLNDSMDSAKHILSSARQETEHAVSSTRTTLLDGVRAVAGVVSILRGFGVGDALGWFGLTRRNRLSSFATFGAGIAVGAGLGMLLAPVSGSDARRAIVRGLKGMLGEAEKTVEKAEKTIEKAEASVEDAGKQTIAKVADLAAKVKTSVIHAEQEMEQALTHAADATKEPARVTPVTEPGNHRPAQHAR